MIIRRLFLSLMVVVFAAGFTPAGAQTYTYTHTRAVQSYADGFGIPHAKTVAKKGTVTITAEAIVVDGVRYLPGEAQGQFKSRGGKQVVIQYLYQGETLSGILLKRGALVQEYYFVNPSCPTCKPIAGR